jgi:hypothetical protein
LICFGVEFALSTRKAIFFPLWLLKLETSRRRELFGLEN